MVSWGRTYCVADLKLFYNQPIAAGVWRWTLELFCVWHQLRIGVGRAAAVGGGWPPLLALNSSPTYLPTSVCSFDSQYTTMGNDQSKAFSSPGQTLGGVPVAGSSTGSAPFSPLSARPTPKPAPQPKPTPSAAAPTPRPAPSRMPGSGQQLDGGTVPPAARTPLSERLASASSGTATEDAEKKARDAREAAAKAAEKRMKGAAAAKAGTGKLPAPSTGEKMPERVIVRYPSRPHCGVLILLFFVQYE